MCVAFPGKILSVEGEHAQVDFAGALAEVNISLIEAAVGDYVLVHAGMAIQKMAPEEAVDLQELFAEVEGAAEIG